MSDSVPSANSEALQLSVQAESDVKGSAAAVSAGALLRQARLAAGLHIAALAVSLKVPVHRLEALESDRYDLLPDAVFARALAASVCRTLKMDAAPVLAQLPAAALPRLHAATARQHDSYTTGSSARGFAAWRSLPKPVIGSAVALVVAAAGLLVWPMLQTSSMSDEASATVATLPGPPEAVPASGSADTAVASGQVPSAGQILTTVVAAPANLTAAVSAPVTSTSSSSTSAALAATTVVPAASIAPNKPMTTPSASPSPAAAVMATSSANGVIVFSPSAASWVEVTDAKGAVVLRRMLAAGEVVGASGALPLNAVVGRADVTKVQVRGQAFDLSSIARENVARFEVK